MALTATMFGIDNVRIADDGGTILGCQVVVSGQELSNGAIFEEMGIEVDLTQTANQIQTALANGIRTFVFNQFGQTIPSNGINVPSFSKG